MGTHYAIYAEVRVGNKWYNLNPLFQRADGKIPQVRLSIYNSHFIQCSK